MLAPRENHSCRVRSEKFARTASLLLREGLPSRVDSRNVDLCASAVGIRLLLLGEAESDCRLPLGLGADTLCGCPRCGGVGSPKTRIDPVVFPPMVIMRSQLSSGPLSLDQSGRDGRTIPVPSTVEDDRLHALASGISSGQRTKQITFHNKERINP